MFNSPTLSLDKLTTYKENSMLEVKSAQGGLPASLWESYSAFANSEGGVIVLGVKENKDGSFFVEGLPDAHKMMKDFWNTINNRQKISSNILTNNMAYTDSIDGKDVIVINIPRAERTSRPVYIGSDPRNGTYRRNGEGDYHCSLEEVSLMIRDSALVTDDNQLVTQFDDNIFCQETIRAYRNIFRLVRPKHLWNNEDDVMFMRRIGAVREDKTSGKFHPTIAGLLMFGYESDIMSFFPNYFLDYQENRNNGIYARWTDRITSQSGDWSGNVFDFILKVIPKLQADLKMPFMFKGNVRDEDTPLHKTIREATINMLTNADFYGRRGVVVQKGADGFKFENPGNMRISLSEALQNSASDPRNGVMMKMLALVEYGERAGSGLQGIFMTWESVFHCTPKLKVSSSGGIDRTILSLNFEGRQPDIESMKRLYGDFGKTGTQKYIQETEDKGGSIQESIQEAKNRGGDTQESIQEAKNKGESIQESNREKVIKILKTNPTLTLNEVAKRIGLSRIGIQKITDKLRAEGLLSRKGSTKAGEWIVKI